MIQVSLPLDGLAVGIVLLKFISYSGFVQISLR